MPKAEVGSVKHLNKQMKARGLTRLRWYCQVCERGMRDENAFKQHTLSESHVRNMLVVGSNPQKVINEYSDQFLKDFLQLLRTGHGEKQVQMNHFYQEYIAKRDHIHMNATKWSSLTELAKHLGKEGICRVEENEKGIFISWIDTSPEALRRQDALRRKEAQDRGDEEWDRRMLKAQIERAERAAKERKKADNDDEEGGEEDKDEKEQDFDNRPDGEKIKLSFGSIAKKPTTAPPPASTATPKPNPLASSTESKSATTDSTDEKAEAGKDAPAPAAPVSLKLGGLGKAQPKNVFAAAKKNALSGGSSRKKIDVPKKMTEMERIMKEEMERKKRREPHGGSNRGGGHFDGPNKKPRF